MALTSNLKSDLLMGIIGDEETCIGFLLAGIGDVSTNNPNFLIVDPSTTNEQLEQAVTQMMLRHDIAILLVAVDVANRIKPTLQRYDHSIAPVLLVIPTKLMPYNVDTDPLIAAARVCDATLTI